MALLSDDEKQTIVTLLGQFVRPAEVVVHMQQVYGVQVDRFQVRSYDPTNCRYEAGPRWLPIFEAARSSYLSSIKDLPIAYKAYRLHMLQAAFEDAKKKSQWRFAAKLLLQAAREVGGTL